MKDQLDDAGITNQDAALRQAAGEAFYNVSPFRLRDLTSRATQQQLRADFEAYLDGFSPNVQEVLEKFKFRNQIPTLVDADALGLLAGEVPGQLPSTSVRDRCSTETAWYGWKAWTTTGWGRSSRN